MSNFFRLGIQMRPCPWCYKIGVVVSVYKKYVNYSCHHKCPYYARWPKKLIEKHERKELYSQKKLTNFIPRPQD